MDMAIGVVIGVAVTSVAAVAYIYWVLRGVMR